jgi:hypothetical protein
MAYVPSAITLHLTNMEVVIFTTAMHGGVELALRTSLVLESAIRPLTSQPTVGVSVDPARNP